METEAGLKTAGIKVKYGCTYFLSFLIYYFLFIYLQGYGFSISCGNKSYSFIHSFILYVQANRHGDVNCV